MSDVEDELSKTCDEILKGAPVDWDTKILSRPDLTLILENLRIVELVAARYREASSGNREPRSSPASGRAPASGRSSARPRVDR